MAALSFTQCCIKNFVALFLFFTSSILKAQQTITTGIKAFAGDSAVIKEIKVGDKITYPFVSLKNKEAEKHINWIIGFFTGYQETDPAKLKRQLEESARATVYSPLAKAMYSILASTPDFISLQLAVCTAEDNDCSYSRGYVFDLFNGELLTTGQILTKEGITKIKKLIWDESRQRLLDAKEKIKQRIGDAWSAKREMVTNYEEEWQKEYNMPLDKYLLTRSLTVSAKGINFYQPYMWYLEKQHAILQPDASYYSGWDKLREYIYPDCALATFSGLPKEKTAGLSRPPVRRTESDRVSFKIRISVPKAYLHAHNDLATRTDHFLSKGDIVETRDAMGDWTYVVYTAPSGKQTGGWILYNEVTSIK